MSKDNQDPDEAEDSSEALALIEPRKPRHYSDEDHAIALATVDLCNQNIRRASIACGVPRKTLEGWVKARIERAELWAEGRHEKRGELATKMESIIHSLVESMPSKIKAATLSQLAVTAGILTDKVRILRGQGLEPDPAMELCRLLNINRSQLPDRLELNPGDTIPEGFGPIIDTIATNPDSYEVPNPASDQESQPQDPVNPNEKAKDSLQGASAPATDSDATDAALIDSLSDEEKPN